MKERGSKRRYRTEKRHHPKHGAIVAERQKQKRRVRPSELETGDCSPYVSFRVTRHG